jgi:hypothetical protein
LLQSDIALTKLELLYSVDACVIKASGDCAFRNNMLPTTHNNKVIIFFIYYLFVAAKVEK